MPALPGWFSGRRPHPPSQPGASELPRALRKPPYALLQQAGQPPVGERLAAGLAGRAVVEGGGGERHRAHRVTADGTGLAGPAVHAHAELFLRLEVAGGEAARALDGIAEHALDRVVQALHLGALELGRRLERRELRGVQDVVGVGVADTGDLGLVAQQSLDLRPVAAESGP